MIAWQKRPLSHRGSIPIRPLNKGVNLALPSNAIAPNEFQEITGYLVTPRGLTKMPGVGFLGSDSTNSYVGSKVRNIATSYNSDGAERSIVLCSGNFYLLNSKYEPLTEIFWQDTYTFNVTVTGINITTTATVTINAVAYNISFDLTLLIKPGDKITIGGNTNIVSTVSGTTITCGAAVIPNGGYASFTVTRIASKDYGLSNPEQVLDCFNYQGNIYITGQGFPLGKLDNSTSPPVIKSTVPITTSSFGYPLLGATPPENRLGTFSAEVGCFFKGYIWLANTEERHNTIGLNKQKFTNRIRWSNPFAPDTDFIDNTRWQDIGFTPGEIVRLLPNGEQLICYKSDAVLYGYQSNIPGLPLSFHSYDTGGVGLVGIRAVTDTAIGHIFVGQNDIYYISQQGVQPIGTPVLKKTIDECYYLSEVQVAHDPKKRCIYFGFPKRQMQIEEIWIFQYETKAWSKYNKLTNFLGMRKNTTQMQWDLIPDATWDSIATASWDDCGAATDGLFELVMAPNNYLETFESFSSIPVNAYSMQFITPDFDIDNPDIVKTFLRLSIKIDWNDTHTVAPVNMVSFTVYGSNDFGLLYKQLGILRIPIAGNEGHCNFRITGSAVRFKLVSTDLIPSYTIIEATIDLAQQGPEQKGV